MRKAALDAVESAHRMALDALRPRLFNSREIASLTKTGGPYALSVGSAAPQKSAPR
jgi:hypothetical protein